DAVVSHRTAAELDGLADDARDPIHVTVPADRYVRPIDGVRVHYSTRSADIRHPTLLPPRTRVEETVIDLAVAAGDLDPAAGRPGPPSAAARPPIGCCARWRSARRSAGGPSSQPRCPTSPMERPRCWRSASYATSNAPTACR